MAEASIKAKTVNGFKWGLIDNIANQGITFLVGLVLARLLSPVEFGILGIITIFINLSITIIDGGFATALIRKADATSDDYDTVFYSNLGISAVLMVLLCATSDIIAEFFDQNILSVTLPVMSIVLLINALSIVQKTILVKKLDFRTQAFISLISSIGSAVVGIGMAMNGYGVWSLVGQQLSRQFIMMLGLWLVSNWRPRLCFSRNSFSDLFGFGSKLLAANLINSFYKDMFLAVIGKLYSTRDLGYYNRADQFNLIFSNNLGQVVQKISLSSLSQIQNEADRLKASFRKFTMFTGMGTFACVFTLAAVAEPLITILIGTKWLPCVHMLQIMSLYAAIYPLQMLNLNVLSIRKRSDRMLRLEIIKKFLFVPVIAVGFFFPLEWLLWAAVLYYYVEFFLNGWYSGELVGYSTWQQVKDLLPVYIISLGVSGCVWLITLTDWSAWLQISVQLFTAAILYVGIYRAERQPEFMEVWNIAISKLRERR